MTQTAAMHTRYITLQCSAGKVSLNEIAFFDAAGTPVQGILRGYKDVRIITYVAFVTYWLISIPMGYAMAHVTSYGPYGYWISLIISLAINALALNIRLWKRTAWSL